MKKSKKVYPPPDRPKSQFKSPIYGVKKGIWSIIEARHRIVFWGLGVFC